MKTLFTLFLVWIFYFPCLAQWEQLNPGVTVDYFSDVFTISQNKAVVVGTNGTILKTTNGGETWELKESGTNEILSNVQFVSEQIGYISGYNGVFLKTIDGGEAWTLSDTGCDGIGGYYGNGMCVVNENLVYVACGESLMKSENGGVTWNATNNLPASTKIQFLSEEVGFTGNYLWDENWENPQIHGTNDGGISWGSI